MVEQVTINNVPYNIEDAVVCAATVNPIGYAEYTGTAVAVQILKGTSVEPETNALDVLTDRGSAIALASILSHANFTINMAGFDLTALQLVGGYSISSYGTTPDEYEVLGPDAGGSGLPYFGLILAGAVADGSGNVMIGMPLCKLDNLPNVSLNENEWTMSEVAGKSIANKKSVWSKKPYVIRSNESHTTITQTADWFNDFFKVTVS